MTNGSSGHHVEYIPMVYPASLNPHHHQAYSKLAASALRSGAGYNLRCDVVSDWARQPTRRRKKNPYQKLRTRQWETTSLFFHEYDMDCAIVSKNNCVNEAVSQGLPELHSAWNGVRRSRSVGHHPAKSLEQQLREKNFV